MKLPLLLASLAALAVSSTVYRVVGRRLRATDERTLTEWKRAAYSSAPADAEQRLRDAIGSGRR